MQKLEIATYLKERIERMEYALANMEDANAHKDEDGYIYSDYSNLKGVQNDLIALVQQMVTEEEAAIKFAQSWLGKFYKQEDRKDTFICRICGEEKIKRLYEQAGYVGTCIDCHEPVEG